MGRCILIPNSTPEPTMRIGSSSSSLARWCVPLLLATLATLAACASAPGPGDDDGTQRGAATDALAAETRAHAAMALEPPDWNTARTAFLEAAEAGSPTAMSHLGWMYEEGHGVAVNGPVAAEWYARAAAAGVPDYALKLGWMYLIGDLVEQSRTLAESWFVAAIEAGHSPARIALASVLIADAQGGINPQRVGEARDLLEQALADGYPTAAFFLARLYIEGLGGHPMDEAKAAHYTRLGAEEGNAQMQGWLAFMYVQGRGVERDYLAAATWAYLAAAGGDDFGDELRLLLEAQLAPEDIDRARQAAVDWAVRRQ
jgi:uncharacterized protein